MLRHYILDANGEPVLVADLMQWAQWFEDSGDIRQVALDEFPDGSYVSTVFLGLDHSFINPRTRGDENAAPVLWETMVFGGPADGHGLRYTLRVDALAGHHQVVAELRAALPVRP